MTTLFVNNLPRDNVNRSDLCDLFRRFGEVLTLNVTDGFGFVTMVHQKDAEFVIAQQNQCVFKGQQLSIAIAHTQKGVTTPCPVFSDFGVLCKDSQCPLSHRKRDLPFCYEFKFRHCWLDTKCRFSHNVTPIGTKSSQKQSSFASDVVSRDSLAGSVWASVINSSHLREAEVVNNKGVAASSNGGKEGSKVAMVVSDDESETQQPHAVTIPFAGALPCLPQTQPPLSPSSQLALDIPQTTAAHALVEAEVRAPLDVYRTTKAPTQLFWTAAGVAGCSSSSGDRKRGPPKDDESVDSVYSSSSVERYCKLRRIRHRDRFFCHHSTEHRREEQSDEDEDQSDDWRGTGKSLSESMTT